MASRLGGFIASLLRDVATGSIERNMRERARELRATLAELGPSFIKIGQALSSRPDLVPRVRASGRPSHCLPAHLHSPPHRTLASRIRAPSHRTHYTHHPFTPRRSTWRN